METPIAADAVTIAPELREKMYEAHDALAGKREHVDRLIAAKKSVEDEIAKDKAELDKAKASYIDGFSASVVDAKAGPKAPQQARAAMTEIGGRIYAAEQTLPDFAKAVSDAEADLRAAHGEYRIARRQVVRQYEMHSVKSRRDHANLISFADFCASGEPIDLKAVLMLYLASFDEGPREMGQPFADPICPNRFFTYLSCFFRVPSPEEVATMRADLERLIWGEREPPGKVKMPDTPPPPKDALSSGVDFKLLGTR